MIRTLVTALVLLLAASTAALPAAQATGGDCDTGADASDTLTSPTLLSAPVSCSTESSLIAPGMADKDYYAVDLGPGDVLAFRLDHSALLHVWRPDGTFMATYSVTQDIPEIIEPGLAGRYTFYVGRLGTTHLSLVTHNQEDDAVILTRTLATSATPTGLTAATEGSLPEVDGHWVELGSAPHALAMLTLEDTTGSFPGVVGRWYDASREPLADAPCVMDEDYCGVPLDAAWLLLSHDTLSVAARVHLEYYY